MAYRGQEDLHASEVSQVWKRSYLDKWTWTLLSHVLWRVQVKTCVGYWQSPHCAVNVNSTISVTPPLPRASHMSREKAKFGEERGKALSSL